MDLPQCAHSLCKVSRRDPAETQEQVARLDPKLVHSDVYQALPLQEELVKDEEIDLLLCFSLELGERRRSMTLVVVYRVGID